MAHERLGSKTYDDALKERLAHVRARIVAAEASSGRSGAGTRLVVATKTVDLDAAVAVVQAGATIIGESRMQELAVKGPALKQAGARIHVIGQLQRNKAGIAVQFADCVQTVDSLALAERLSRLCQEADRDLDVMIQVNVSGEVTKAGVAPEQALDLAVSISSLPRLRVTGYMTIGLNSRDEDTVRAGYARLRDIRDRSIVLADAGQVPANLSDAWELSMGMSADLEWAIAEGATMVRVGTAIMGPRTT